MGNTNLRKVGNVSVCECSSNKGFKLNINVKISFYYKNSFSPNLHHKFLVY